jgi:hypothetical protein
MRQEPNLTTLNPFPCTWQPQSTAESAALHSEGEQTEDDGEEESEEEEGQRDSSPGPFAGSSFSPPVSDASLELAPELEEETRIYIQELGRPRDHNDDCAGGRC